MQEVLNISVYKFVALPDAAQLRVTLLERAISVGLRGTILLAEEGINLFLAGTEPSVRTFLTDLKKDHRFADLHPKESWSDTVPFRYLRVKRKNEIIRMNHPAIQPAQGRAPAVDAATLKRWLDAGHDDVGRAVVMLDTRNAFEVDQGTFDGAIDWRLGKFSDFPEALAAHRAELAGKCVVSFCTGGIRCEKAALVMREAGLQDVWQLEGGILQYFEQEGSAHFHGECFVFDERQTLAADLRPADEPRF